MAFIGEIRANAGNFMPLGWLVCNGQMLAVEAWPELFAAIGYKYGGSPESGLFAVPDCAGRVLRGSNEASGGANSITLAASQLPAHSHVIKVGTSPNGSLAPTSGAHLTATASGGQTAAAIYTQSPASPVAIHGVETTSNHEQQSIDITPAFVGVTWIICAAHNDC